MRSGAAAVARAPLPWRLAIVLLLALAACAEHNPAEPLSSFQIRERLVGRLVVATEPDGRQLTMRFSRNGVATVTDGSAEFVHWTIGAAQGLCLQGFEGQSKCAPVYQLTPTRLRWADVTFGVLGYGMQPLEAPVFPRPILRPPPVPPHAK